MEEGSFVATDDYVRWFRSIWDDIRGASLKDHPAPYPLELATRLIRMFSFIGDTVLDPFAGTGTTALAAMRYGRSSLSYEVEPAYVALIKNRLGQYDAFNQAVLRLRERASGAPLLAPRSL